MLHELLIRNFALIDEVHIQFGPSFNVFTGAPGWENRHHRRLEPDPGRPGDDGRDSERRCRGVRGRYV